VRLSLIRPLLLLVVVVISRSVLILLALLYYQYYYYHDYCDKVLFVFIVNRCFALY
ncbi:hypothetical protein BDF19DRAFT_405389, partial [Syncephalis fuscata]